MRSMQFLLNSPSLSVQVCIISRHFHTISILMSRSVHLYSQERHSLASCVGDVAFCGGHHAVLLTLVPTAAPCNPSSDLLLNGNTLAIGLDCCLHACWKRRQDAGCQSMCCKAVWQLCVTDRCNRDPTTHFWSAGIYGGRGWQPISRCSGDVGSSSSKWVVPPSLTYHGSCGPPPALTRIHDYIQRQWGLQAFSVPVDDL
jgi:hypothetical protein